MLIVTVTRGDLRDEFAMADEAFALSPIAARAIRPSEADYDAISDAFMETSRGRWFLHEYARRNRNADTRMVLDAVARIEASLATQKQTPAEDATAAIADIRALVEQGRAAVAVEMAKLDVTGHLAPAYGDAQTIRKIVWTLRESGTDLRICDLLDAQAKAIEGSLDLLTAAGPREAILAVFDGLLQRLETSTGNEPASQPVDEPATEARASSTVEAAHVATQATTPIAAAEAREEAVAPPVNDEAATSPVTTERDNLAFSPPVTESIAVDLPPPQNAEAEVAIQDSDVAHDDALLDLIAMEMAVPDDLEIEPPPVAEPMARDEVPASGGLPPTPPAPPMPAKQPSLGAMLLASGTIQRPRPSHSDRFASIRRLSRAEKVALFS